MSYASNPDPMTSYAGTGSPLQDRQWRRRHSLWLLAPTVKCSSKAFKDTPIGESDSDDVADTDKDRVPDYRDLSHFRRFGAHLVAKADQTHQFAVDGEQ